MEDIELFVEEASRESSRRVGSRDLVAHAAANRTYFAELWSIRKQLLPIERRVIGQIPRKNISNHNLCFSLISSISNSWIKTRRNNDNNTFPRLPSRIYRYRFSGRPVCRRQPRHRPSIFTFRSLHYSSAAGARRTFEGGQVCSPRSTPFSTQPFHYPTRSFSRCSPLHDPTGPVTK